MQQFLVFGFGFVIAWMPHTLHLSLRRPTHTHIPKENAALDGDNQII